MDTYGNSPQPSKAECVENVSKHIMDEEHFQSFEKEYIKKYARSAYDQLFGSKQLSLMGWSVYGKPEMIEFTKKLINPNLE